MNGAFGFGDDLKLLKVGTTSQGVYLRVPGFVEVYEDGQTGSLIRLPISNGTNFVVFSKTSLQIVPMSTSFEDVVVGTILDEIKEVLLVPSVLLVGSMKPRTPAIDVVN